jgi:hypothetical protein
MTAEALWRKLRPLIVAYGNACYSEATAGECGGPEDVADAKREQREVMAKLRKVVLAEDRGVEL